MKSGTWFDIVFVDEKERSYRDSILAGDIFQAKKYARFLHVGSVGHGEIQQIADDGSRIGDPVPFCMSKWEGDRDAA